MPLPRSLVAALILVVACLVCATPARADEVAPALEGADLRQQAQLELKQLIGTMPEADRRRLAGIYVAFDPSVSDLVAQAACDDDGDYVIVVSDGMLRLLATVSRAERMDDRTGSQKLEEYAAFVARSQIPGRRLLPPPPGFYEPESLAEPREGALEDALAFIVADELARLRAGDLVCPRPTVTRESGDDVWTSAEQQRAKAIAARVYPAHQRERDAEALAHVRASGRSEKGTLAVLRFFARLAGEKAAPAVGFAPSYLAHHPDTGGRLTALKHALDAPTGPPGAKSVTSGS